MAQVDTSFWFALPSASSSQPVTHRLTFQSYDTAAVIEIEKIYPSGTTTDTIHIAEQQYRRYDLGTPGSSCPINTPLYRGIHIRSTASISCVYDIFVDTLLTRGERYTLKGGNALGTHFAVPAPEYVLNNSHAHNSIEMIATEDSTMAVIDIPTKYPLGGTPVFWTRDTVFLQRGESYIVRNDTTGFVGGGYEVGVLNGTIVRTTRPVALNSSDAGNYGIYEDLPNPSGEQLVPTHLCGTNFMIPMTGLHCDDPYARVGIDSVTIIISAPYDSTTIQFYGGTWGTRTMNRGDMCIYKDFDPYHLTNFTGVRSDKPIAIIEIVCHNQRMSYTMPPPLECAGSTQIAAYSAIDVDSTFNYTILGQSHIQTHGLINGSALSASGWWTLDDYALHEAITSDTIERTLATIDSGTLHLYTWNRGEMSRFYTCHSEYATHSYLAFVMGITNFVSGDTIHFRYAQRNVSDIVFTGPNGICIINPNDTILQVADSWLTGWYYLQGRSVGGCHDTITDSVYIHVQPLNNEVFDTVRYDICESQLPFTVDSLTFEAGGTYVRHYPGSLGSDSIVTYIINILPNSDTAIFDTILVTQLPWVFMDSTFTDSVTDFIITTVNAQGCDSLIHYNLYVRWCDTLLYYICESQLPYTIDTLVFDTEGSQTVNQTDGQLTTYIVHVIPSSDTSIYDTIVDTQLPWVFMDSTFTNSVADFIFTLVNDRGCDSTIHYNLYVFWNGDHCDTSLSYPNVVTPNGDGINDKFVIGGLVENNCFKYNELTIYNRDGRPIYHVQNIHDDSQWWDPAAHRIPAGTYFYFFKAHGIHIWTQHTGVIEVLK